MFRGNESILLGFGIFNVLLLLVFWFAFGAGAVASLGDARAVVSLQERRYLEMLRGFDEAEIDFDILRHDEVFFVLSDINEMAEDFGLLAESFFATETVLDGGVREMFVRAEFFGGFYDILDFLYELNEGRGYMRSFSISDIIDGTRLRLYFSLFSIAGD